MALNTSVTLGGGPYTSPVGGSLDMAPVLLKKKLLSVVEKRVVFDNLADHEPLPQGNGRTVRYVRYERVGLPFKPADEGVTSPDTRSLSVSFVEASVDQWIDTGVVTDVSEIVLAHKPTSILMDRMSVAASELYDREAQKALREGATSVIFPVQAYTSRTQLTVNDFLDASTLRRAIAQLRDNGVPDFDGKFYLVIDPYIEMDLMKDNTFAAMAVAQKPDVLMKGRMVTEWLGFKIIVSNNMPVIVLNTNAAAVVTTPSEAANALATGKDVKITGLTDFGQETEIGSVNTSGVSGFTANDIVVVTLAAPVSPIVRYNIYAGESGGTLTLQAEAVQAGAYALTSTGVTAQANTTAVKYSTTGKVAPVTPGSGVKVHQSYIIGKEAFANIPLDELEMFTTPNVASDSDPGKQRRKITYKLFMKYAVKNSAFYRRVESESDHD